MSANETFQLYSDFIGKWLGRVGKILSVFVRNRVAFVFLMATLAAIKLWLSSVVSASFDLQSITAILNPTFQNSPWIILERLIFDSWKLATASTDMDPSKWWLTPPGKMTPDLLLLALLFRLPTFLADVGISLALYLVTLKATQSTGLSRLSCLVWFLNPYSFLAGELLGVPDIAVAFFTVLTLLFLSFRRILPAGLCLALAIGLKLYPILLVPVMVLFLREIRARLFSIVIFILLSVVGVIGYLSWLYPYAAAALSLDYTPVSQPLNLFTISFAPGQVGLISVTLMVLVLVYLSIWAFMRRAELISTIILTLLAYYLFSSPYPQYFIWVMPFLILDVVLIRRYRGVLLTLMMVFLFSFWVIISYGFATPSGYSLLFPIIGNNISTEQIVNFTTSSVTKILLLPLLNAGLYSIILIYALDLTLRDGLGLRKKRI